MLGQGREHRVPRHRDGRAGRDVAGAEGGRDGHQLCGRQPETRDRLRRTGGDQVGDGRVGIAVEQKQAHRPA
jgi:hypothetical protein